MCNTVQFVAGAAPIWAYAALMRRVILTACVLTLGCGGTIDLSNSDAGTNGSRGGVTPTAPAPEQQVSTSLPSWCPQICAKLLQCQSPGTDSNCVSDCNSTVSKEFLGHGNTCAQFGLNFMNCLNSATCSELNNPNGMCNIGTTAEEVACGYGDLDASVPDANPPPYPVVTCQSGSGLASGGGNVPIGATVCQNNVNGCTDGHSYSIDCVYEGNNQSTCTCYRDGSTGATFSTGGASCPYVGLINTYCGWQLASI